MTIRPDNAKGFLPLTGESHIHVFAALAQFIRELIVEGTARAWMPPAPAASASGGHRP